MPWLPFAQWFRRQPSPPAAQADVYTRAGCGLCDDAVEMLREEGVEVRLIDIEGDEELTQRYGTTIPVVWIDGRERFRGRVNRVLLRRLLKQRNTE